MWHGYNMLDFILCVFVCVVCFSPVADALCAPARSSVLWHTSLLLPPLSPSPSHPLSISPPPAQGQSVLSEEQLATPTKHNHSPLHTWTHGDTRETFRFLQHSLGCVSLSPCTDVALSRGPWGGADWRGSGRPLSSGPGAGFVGGPAAPAGLRRETLGAPVAPPASCPVQSQTSAPTKKQKKNKGS